jgi:hypothetical protein
MKVKTVARKTIEIPDENIEAILHEDARATWYEDENGILELSEYNEWDNNKGQWIEMGYKLQHEVTGECHILPLNAFKKFKMK